MYAFLVKDAMFPSSPCSALQSMCFLSYCVGKLLEFSSDSCTWSAPPRSRGWQNLCDLESLLPGIALGPICSTSLGNILTSLRGERGDRLQVILFRSWRKKKKGPPIVSAFTIRNTIFSCSYILIHNP